MLSPRQSPTRERISLDGLWRFALDPRGVGRAERWWARVLPGDGEMPVPASFNDIVPTQEARDHVGDVWYQHTVRVPRGWDGQRILLRFDAATHRATAWVGERQAVEHEGGYTPFEVAGFSRTSGFIDDTRAFCSIPARHDMSRRVDAGVLARLVAEHRLDEDEAAEVAVAL